MPGALSQKLESAFAAAHNRLEPQQIDLPKGLKIRVRFLEDDRRQMVAWRDKSRPSETEIKILARDAGFCGHHLEYRANTQALITEFPEEERERIAEAEANRAARGADVRARLIAGLVSRMLEAFKIPDLNQEPYRALWSEGLEIVPDEELKRRESVPVAKWHHKEEVNV
jgi:hypothetical protein